MDHLTEDTRALLRAAREIHAERHGAQTFTQGTHLPLEEAGRRIGINPERLRYYDADAVLKVEKPIPENTGEPGLHLILERRLT